MFQGLARATKPYMANDSGVLLTAAEVAERYRVSTATVGRWVKAGHLQAIRLPGGNLRFRPADVDALEGTDIDDEDEPDPDPAELEPDHVEAPA